MNLVGALLFCVVAAYSFLFSCLAPDERTALALSTALTMVLSAFHMATDLNGPFRWLNHLSLFAVLKSQRLIHGQGTFATDVTGLALASAVLIIAAVAGFRRRQLTL